jgi:hypothetical protein
MLQRHGREHSLTPSIARGLPHQSSSTLGNDDNPGNVLWDGERVTGFIDFTWACCCMASPVIRLVSPQSATAVQPVLPAAR